MSRLRIPFHISRSLACLDALKVATGAGPTEIQRRVAKTYQDKFNLSAPKTDVTREYFRGKRPIPYDPLGTVAPSYLMALELTFEGSSEIFFHSFFNLTLGALPSSEKLIGRSQYYPEAWIEQHRRLGEFSIVREEEEGNERLITKRSRRGAWAPDRPLGWIHLNMLNLSDQIRDILMTKTGLASAWSRAYRDIDTELNLLQPFRSFDSITAIFGLMLEGAEIGDEKRFAAARECLKLQLGYLHDIPELKRVSSGLVELAEVRITEAHAASYEPVASKLTKYPLTWSSAIYKYWIAELSEKKFNR